MMRADLTSFSQVESAAKSVGFPCKVLTNENKIPVYIRFSDEADVKRLQRGVEAALKTHKSLAVKKVD